MKGNVSQDRLGNFRQGDRSEYLAAFALSRFSFLHSVPRQEDFGVVDFRCTLTRLIQKKVVPERSFYVQVKSKIAKWTINGAALRWLSHHMDHPLFLCFVDKKTGMLTMYSCSRAWLGLFLRTGAIELTFIPNSHGPDEHMELLEEHGKASFRIHMGPPIMRISIAELERDPDMAYEVMEPWIEEGVANIARRNLGRITVSCFESWEPNRPPDGLRFVRYYIGPNFGVAERDIAAILTGLAHNYRHHKLADKLTALRPYLSTLSEHLDGHGRLFADGTLIVESNAG